MKFKSFNTKENSPNSSRTNWLLSYADLLMVMLIFFIMLNYNSVQNYNKTQKILKSIDGKFNNKPIDNNDSFGIVPFSILEEFLLPYKNNIKFELKYHQQNYLIHISEDSIFNMQENKPRAMGKSFLLNLANKVNEIGDKKQIAVKIMLKSNGLDFKSQKPKINNLNYIKDIFQQVFQDKIKVEFGILNTSKSDKLGYVIILQL
jgi:hypothetical protein